MNTKDFKTIFNAVAVKYGYKWAFGGWFKESGECIGVLDLQKSNFGNYVYLNLKIFVQGAFGNNYRQSKDLVKKDVGDIFTRQPVAFDEVFNFENELTEEMRTDKLNDLFEQFVEPFVTSAMSIRGIQELESKGEVYLLPAVKNEITRLSLSPSQFADTPD